MIATSYKFQGELLCFLSLTAILVLTINGMFILDCVVSQQVSLRLGDWLGTLETPPPQTGHGCRGPEASHGTSAGLLPTCTSFEERCSKNKSVRTVFLPETLRFSSTVRTLPPRRPHQERTGHSKWK